MENLEPPWMKKNLIDFISNFGLDESCQCKVPIIQMHIKYIFFEHTKFYSND